MRFRDSKHCPDDVVQALQGGAPYDPEPPAVVRSCAERTRLSPLSLLAQRIKPGKGGRIEGFSGQGTYAAEDKAERNKESAIVQQDS